MSAGDAADALPTPTRTRWQPLRLGLVELYHYDVEEFRFRDGHLLLRGNNGTGKSKVLSLTLPFLLDANTGASRVEPDGDRSKRMEWNLLMGRRYERRVGYAWLEFGRRDADGTERYLTLGCGLRAVAGRPGVESWYFLTAQRVGADLWLTTPERTALTRDRLGAALAGRGRLYETAQAYRRAVDEALFGLGAERYDALVDTLIQLRQPQLSRAPDEQRLSDALTEALPPLDRAALEDVAEALGELDELRRNLDELEAMRQAVHAFGTRYRRYAAIATRRRARGLRQAQTEFDAASRAANEAEREFSAAKAEVEQRRAAVENADRSLAATRARLELLRADPVMRDAVRLDDARQIAGLRRSAAGAASSRRGEAEAALARAATDGERREAELRAAREQLAATDEALHRAAGEAGLAAAAADALATLDAACEAPQAALDATLAGATRRLREAAGRRREQVGVVRRRQRELQDAERRCESARAERTARADAFDSAQQAAETALRRWRGVTSDWLGAWRGHVAALRVLAVEPVDERLDELEAWVETRATPNPLRAALDAARSRHERESAAREAGLRGTDATLASEQESLRAERAALEAGIDPPPPPPYPRDPQARATRAGAPLWALVDFAAHVEPAARAGIEAALEAAGLLDAWVVPDGTLVDPATHDTLLVPRRGPAGSASLADWLVATVPREGRAAGVAPAAVRALLESIACGEADPESAECWVAPDGRFRLGALRGAWTKAAAGYVGHAAREAARRSRLAALAVRGAELDAARAALALELEALAERRAQAVAEAGRAPREDDLLAAAAAHDAAEHGRRAAQERLGEADARVSVAERARDDAQAALDSDARDLALPPASEALDDVEQAVSAFDARAPLAVEARRRTALARRERQEAEARREDEAAAVAAVREAEQAAEREAAAAEAALATLQGSVGVQVSELLQRIEDADAAQREQESAFRKSQAHLNVASARRGTAETAARQARERLDERTVARSQAAESLRAFAETGLVAIAGPALEIPEPGTAWGVDAALTLARRAEQALVDVDADDAAWQRVQRDVGTDFQALQTALSAQGHSANFEPGEHGLVVRIVHRQRAERPDLLERRLEAELGEQRTVLSAQERAVLEEHLEKEIASNLQRMIVETETRVRTINAELERRPTSTGVRYRLDWQALADEDGPVAGLAAARRLLRKSADAWSPDERRQVGEFLQARIAAERLHDEGGPLLESLARALDYRRWHRFAVERRHDGEWRPLKGPASSGERALGLTVPLFAAASSHYESAGPHAPRLVLLDEAFAGIDDEARANCMALIREFDLDFVMTSEREWGCYPELPGLSICQLVRREGIDAVHVSRWSWDGRTRRREAEPERRFPPRGGEGDDHHDRHSGGGRDDDAEHRGGDDGA